MAKMISPYPGISVYKDKNGNIIARAKPGPNKRLKTDPRFKRTRESCAAFGAASKTSRLLHLAFSSWVRDIDDSYAFGRLVKTIRQIVQTIPREDWTKPDLTKAEWSALRGFDFNSKLPLKEIFKETHSIAVDIQKTSAEITIPPFIPCRKISRPTFHRPTHFRMVPAIILVNLKEKKYYCYEMEEEPPLKYDSKYTDPIHFKKQIDTDENTIVIAAVGIRIYNLRGGKNTQLASRSLAIIDVAKS